MPKLLIPRGATPRQVCDLAKIEPGVLEPFGIDDMLTGRGATLKVRSAVKYFLLAFGVERSMVRDTMTLAELCDRFNMADCKAAWLSDTWPRGNHRPGPPAPQPPAPFSPTPAPPTPMPENPIVIPDLPDDLPEPPPVIAKPSPVGGLEAFLTGIMRGEIDAAFAKRPVVDQAEIERLVQKFTTITRVEIARPGQDPEILPGTHHAAFPALLKLASARHNVYLYGPAGSGKSTAAKNAATALKLGFASTGKVDSKYDLLGFRDAHGRMVRTPFRETWEGGGLFLFDEMDRSDPSAVVAMNNGLATGQLDFPDGTIAKHADCVVIAGGNTAMRGGDRLYSAAIGQDASVSDRFVFLPWNYDEGLERSIAGDDAGTWVSFVQNVRRSAAKLKIDLVASPRSSIEGAKLLRAGFNRQEVASMVLWRGLDPAMIAKITADVS